MDRIQQEIETINAEFPELKNYYQLLDRAGRGTFSKVYKARDLLYENYMPWSLQKKVENAIDSDHHLVAIKLIYGISSPKRVANEISCLSELRGSPCVIPMITALRNQDVTYLVLPFIEFDHFEDIYPTMTLLDLKHYISELLIGLKYVHEKGIIHRDVKPGNFLYNKTTKTGYLGDFGLAQRVINYDIHKPGHRHATVDPIYTEHQNGPAGYFLHDKRKHIHVDRSGTRSFRAPEIYLHSMRQTTAMDIWAVGVILLSFLTNVYPFFDPEDSAAGIVELISVFGTKKVHEFAKFYGGFLMMWILYQILMFLLLGRNLKTNIPDMPEGAIGMDELCRYFNNGTIETWDKHDYLLAVDLMKNCLQLIDSNRLSAAEALKHPFLKEVMETKSYS
ncbi:kinase-like protein [Rhizopus microsporus ATCC 52813]|uniref:non-specific serine/threonine protein kinase n=2 Tax=Rhizopus microsporus TaxID=58291 RepID=A0A2G4SLV3_RHIZD|nr:kinase-like protein [Rhizopus microsporus ATCC 52813]PHZ09733.1 kinase-like protein [Rhizopus microsporus ATCC 52813]